MEDWMQDPPRAVLETQRRLRAEVDDLAGRHRRLTEALNDEVAAVRAEQAGGGAVPTLDHADLAAGRVDAARVARVRRRGCVVVRGVFARERARDWDGALARYIDALRPPARGPGRRQIHSLYWSPPQMQARQDPALALTRAWLNRLWTFERQGRRCFDPDRQFNYADRIRRREPGDETLRIPPHTDHGSIERWCDPGFRRVFRAVFEGDPFAFDPFDANDRTRLRELPSPAACSVFRSFQGWTALTRQGPGDGTLQLVPIACTAPWMLTRALQPDVPEGDLCGARAGEEPVATPRWHAELLAGLVPIPEVEPGDTVWWHPDLVHAVEPRHGGRGHSTVLYIAAAPWCEKNAAYAARQAEAFLAGRSGPDFPPDDHEHGFAGRATEAELSELGRRQMGLLAWN